MSSFTFSPMTVSIKTAGITLRGVGGQPKIDLATALTNSDLSDQEFVTLHEGETRIY